jgi:ribosomal protein S18 acetylase RimI-like enzyme
MVDETLLSRVEDASLNASAPTQQRWMDGWMLRYCPGKARRSRCINALATGRLPVPEKLRLAAALYESSALPMVFRITRFTQPPQLDTELQALGWKQIDLTRVQVKVDLTAHREAPLPPGTHWAELDASAFAEAVGELRGSPRLHRQSHAQRLAASPVPYRGFVIRRDRDGLVLACGQTAQEAELVGIYDVHTLETERNKGLASLLCERLLAQSAKAVAGVAYLQVESGNAAALHVYGQLGFVDGYTYHYREAPAA